MKKYCKEHTYIGEAEAIFSVSENFPLVKNKFSNWWETVEDEVAEQVIWLRNKNRYKRFAGLLSL